jgi:hypothetical protein
MELRLTATNVLPLRKPRNASAADAVSRALASGKKLPLDLMLEQMWHLADETERLATSRHAEDHVMARVVRDRLFRVAAECAPYFHAKLANTVISGDPANPLQIENRDRYARLTTEDATKYLAAIESGEMSIQQVHDALGQ